MLLTIVLDDELKVRQWRGDPHAFEGSRLSLEIGRSFLSSVSMRDRARIERWIANSRFESPAPAYFSLIDQQLRYIHASGQLVFFEHDGAGSYCLSVSVLGNSANPDAFEQIAQSVSILSKIVSNAVEAIWCIEFLTPVDLDTSDDQIVDQFFENPCRWLICNQAVLRLYGVPEDVDILSQPVSRYFSRSAANVRYVRNLIKSDYWIDSALSIDLRHDGKPLYVENSVRSEIVENKLLKFWGTMHNVTESRTSQRMHRMERRSLESAFSSIPVMIIVLSSDGKIAEMNPACELTLGLHRNDWIGRPIGELVVLPDLLDRARIGEVTSALTFRKGVSAEARSGEFFIHARQTLEGGMPVGYVLTILPSGMALGNVAEMNDAV